MFDLFGWKYELYNLIEETENKCESIHVTNIVTLIIPISACYYLDIRRPRNNGLLMTSILNNKSFVSCLGIIEYR